MKVETRVAKHLTVFRANTMPVWKESTVGVVAGSGAGLAILAGAAHWRSALASDLGPYVVLCALFVFFARACDGLITSSNKRPATAICVLSVAALVFGTQSQIDLIASLGCVALLASAFRFIFRMSTVAPAFILLLFAFPFPALVSDPVREALGDAYALLAEVTLTAFDARTIRLGNTVLGDGLSLVVSERCDGVGLLGPMLLAASTGSLLARRSWQEHLFVLVVCVLAALALNALRVVAIAATAVKAPGHVDLVHDVAGVSVVVLAGLLPQVIIPHGEFWQGFSCQKLAPAIAFAVGAGTAMALASLAPLHPWDRAAASAKPLSSSSLERAPFRVGSFYALSAEKPDQQREILGADEAFARTYRDAKTGQEVLVTAMAFASSAQADDRRHHPERCFGVLGWRVLRAGALERDARWFVVAKGSARQLGLAKTINRGEQGIVTILAVWRGENTQSQDVKMASELVQSLADAWHAI